MNASDEAPHPAYGGGDQRPPHDWVRPTPQRIDNAVESLTEVIRVFRTMDQPLDSEPRWEPSKAGRNRLRTTVEHALRADAKWRWEHPDEPA